MQLTEKEKSYIAYTRAYELNKTKRKMIILVLIAMILMILDVTILNNYQLPMMIAGFCIIVAGTIASYFIRRPEKNIADKILKEG
jgi:hypothetical protein